MKKSIALLIALLCAACAGCVSGRGNTEYARNCGYAMDQELLCNGYNGPGSF